MARRGRSFRLYLSYLPRGFHAHFHCRQVFVYRLLYCYQTDTPPYLSPVSQPLFRECMQLLEKIKQELQYPTADSYNLIVAVLYYLLLIINREYAATYHLPMDVPKNNYAYQFKELLEQHIREMQRVTEYADMLHISRITLNHAVMAQFGVSASHLLKQRLLEELKMNCYSPTAPSVSWQMNFISQTLVI